MTTAQWGQVWEMSWHEVQQNGMTQQGTQLERNEQNDRDAKEEFILLYPITVNNKHINHANEPDSYEEEEEETNQRE